MDEISSLIDSILSEYSDYSGVLYVIYVLAVYVIGYVITKRLIRKRKERKEENKNNDFNLIITHSRMLADRAAARAETIRMFCGGCLEDDSYRNFKISELQNKFQEEVADKNCLVMGFGSFYADIDDAPGQTDSCIGNISTDEAPFELIIDKKKVDFKPNSSIIYAFLLDEGVHSISFKVRGEFVNPFKTEKNVTVELYGKPKFMAVDLCIYTENSYKNGKLRQGTDARFLNESKESLEDLLDEYCDAYDLDIIVI